MTRPLSDAAAAEGLGYVESYPRGRPMVVEVFDGDIPTLKPGGPLLARVAARPGEHPTDTTRRALVAARRARLFLIPTTTGDPS